MRLLIIFIVLAYSIVSFAYDEDTIKVAVIDTGYSFKSTWKGKKGVVKPKICKQGHKDFSGTGIEDTHGHGTHVAGIIAKYAGKANYCLVIMKVYSEDGMNQKHVNSAFRRALSLNVDIINYSGGGKAFDHKEYITVKKILNKGIVLVSAAGNEKKKNLDYHILNVKYKYLFTATKERVVYGYTIRYINRKTGEITEKKPENAYYPAAYDPRIISVTATNPDNTDAEFSNTGAAFYHKEFGNNIRSTLPDNKVGYMSGTSQAAPTRTGKMIKLWKK